MSDVLPTVDVKTGNQRPTCSTSHDLAATLSDPEHIVLKTMTESLSYSTALPHELAWINVNTAITFHDIALNIIMVQKAQGGQVTDTAIVGGGEEE